jgi:hypothetical protein
MEPACLIMSLLCNLLDAGFKELSFLFIFMGIKL